MPFHKQSTQLRSHFYPQTSHTVREGRGKFQLFFDQIIFIWCGRLCAEIGEDIPLLQIISIVDIFLARLTKSRGSYCRTPGVCRRRCRRRPHLVKGCLQALIISINLIILCLCLP